MKNRSLHSEMKQSYKAIFNIEPRVGLSTSALPTYAFRKKTPTDDVDEFQKVLMGFSEEEEENDGEKESVQSQDTYFE